MGGCCKYNNLIVLSTLLGLATIVFVVVGFATDYWVERSVNRDSLSTIYKTLSNTHQGLARFYHKRHRGLIKECYPTASSEAFLSNADNVVDYDCFFIDFDDPKDKSISTDYITRMNLLRACLAMYVLGLVAVVVSFFVGMILCCLKSPQVAFISSILSFLGGIMVVIAIVLFHATEYTETNETGRLGEMVFENQWDKALRLATDSELDYSYALAWVGAILAIFDGVLYILTAKALSFSDNDSLSSYSSDNKNFKDLKSRSSKRSAVYDNPGMMMPVGYPTLPMFFEGYPHEVQALPSMRAVDVGPSPYRMSDRESSGSGRPTSFRVSTKRESNGI